MAILLTSEAAPAAALIDRDQMPIVKLRERDPEPVTLARQADNAEVERGMVAAGGGRKGKRTEYRCAACGYGIVVYGQAPGCPMCDEARWEHVEVVRLDQLVELALTSTGFGRSFEKRRNVLVLEDGLDFDRHWGHGPSFRLPRYPNTLRLVSHANAR